MVYLLADMSGDLESPSYAIANISDSLKNIILPKGFSLKEEYTHQPEMEDNYTLKWDGDGRSPTKYSGTWVSPLP